MQKNARAIAISSHRNRTYLALSGWSRMKKHDLYFTTSFPSYRADSWLCKDATKYRIRLCDTMPRVFERQASSIYKSISRTLQHISSASQLPGLVITLAGLVIPLSGAQCQRGRQDNFTTYSAIIHKW